MMAGNFLRAIGERHALSLVRKRGLSPFPLFPFSLSRLRSMKRLWEKDSQTVGVAARREKEAVYFEEALKCSCWK